MTAKNWASCPKCYRDAVAARDKEVEAVSAVYGRVDLEEWEARVAAVPEKPYRQDFNTLREDYEVTGAVTGVLNFSYLGSCHVCGLQLNVMHDRHPFPGFEEKP